MSTGLKREYLKNIRQRYHRSSKNQRTLILDEFCEVCNLTRKHAIRLLNEDMITVQRRPGPIRKYGADVDRQLRHLWECMGRICTKKMVGGNAFMATSLLRSRRTNERSFAKDQLCNDRSTLEKQLGVD